MRPIGVLGGMGPEATILLMQKVLGAVKADDDADHIPLIVHQNPQVPSRIKALIEGTGDDPGPALAQMSRDLQAAGAMALAMPCNTAHHYAPAVRAASDLPFLDMLALTATHLAQAGAARVGMLASPATRAVGVFDAAFAARGLVPVWVDDEAAMLALIRAVKAGEDAQAMSAPFRALAGNLAAKGADHLLIACTELSLLAPALDGALPVTDSLDCLTRAIVETARG